MGFLGNIFGDSDLGCAVGFAVSPFGALATGECDATIGKVVDKVSDAIVPEVSKCDRDEYFVDALRLLADIATPIPAYSLGILAARQINQSLGLSPEAKAECEHQLDSIEKALLLTTFPLLFPVPMLPVAVGLERYVRPMVSPITAEDLGNFAADLFASAAMIGIAGAGAKVLSTGVKKAVIGNENLEPYLKQMDRR